MLGFMAIFSMCIFPCPISTFPLFWCANYIDSSRAYATEMFYTAFKRDVMDANEDKRYRKIMLERGGSVDEMETLLEFLGREPSNDAFYQELGLL